MTQQHAPAALQLIRHFLQKKPTKKKEIHVENVKIKEIEISHIGNSI